MTCTCAIAVKEQDIALGTFLEWQHKKDRNGIKILDRKK